MISIFLKRKLFPMLLTITLWDNLNFTFLCADDPIAKRDLAPIIDSNSKPSTMTRDAQQSNLKVHACMCGSSL
jgi:hypothetical protein